MNKSLEALDILKNNISDYLDTIQNNEETISKSEFMFICIYPLFELIKQDLEAYEQLKQDHDKTLINNGELCVKVCKLEKENQGLVVNKNLAQKLAVEYKNKIHKLEKENQELKEQLENSYDDETGWGTI